MWGRGVEWWIVFMKGLVEGVEWRDGFVIYGLGGWVGGGWVGLTAMNACGFLHNVAWRLTHDRVLIEID